MTSPFILCATGGPGAGKTDCLKLLAETIRREGRSAFVVPEVATLLINGGAKPWEMSPQEHLHFQVAHVTAQDSLEKAAIRMMAHARHSARPVILCDRGLMDGAAYYGLTGWDEVLREIGTNTQEVMAGRYHAIVHLESSACLSESAYPGAINPARWQDAAGARASDRRLHEVWSSHPRHHVIRARDEFADKLAALEALVRGLVADSD